MNKLEKLIIRLCGHAFDAPGLVTIPTLLFTLMIGLLVFIDPDKQVFWLGLGCMCVIVQAFGVIWVRHIRLKHNDFDK